MCNYTIPETKLAVGTHNKSNFTEVVFWEFYKFLFATLKSQLVTLITTYLLHGNFTERIFKGTYRYLPIKLSSENIQGFMSSIHLIAPVLADPSNFQSSPTPQIIQTDTILLSTSTEISMALAAVPGVFFELTPVRIILCLFSSQ